MYGYIYLTTCAITGKMYIGARKWSDIMTMHKDSYFGSGKLLREDVKKYGKKYFSKVIITIARSLYELNELERHFISKYQAVSNPQFYNMKAGGGVHPQSMSARYQMRWAHRYKRKER